MTITATTNKVVYTGDAATTVFPFTFPVNDEDHLAVYEYVIATGVLTLIDPANYTVTGVPGTGSVTYEPSGSPLAATKKLLIIRTVPFTQDMDINNQGGFHPDSLEDQLDLLEMQIQQVSRGQLQRNPADTSSFGANEVLMADASGYVVSTGEDAEALFGAEAAAAASAAAASAAETAAETAQAAAEGAAESILSNVESRATAITTTFPAFIDYVRTAGYAEAGDGGGALYYEIPLVTADKAWHVLTNGSTRRWTLAPGQRIDARIFGAVGNGVADDRAALQTAIDYCMSTGADLHLAGWMRVTDTINVVATVINQEFKILGENGNRTRIYFDNTVPLQNLFKIGEDTNYFVAKDIEFLNAPVGGSVHLTGRAFYFRDTSAFGLAPSWKHSFEGCRITGFAEGVLFDGGATIVEDTHLDSVMFLHSKFRNNKKGLIYNNIQSVNHHIISTDFENDHADDATEKWPHITFLRGTTVAHVGGSVVGHGPYVRYIYSEAGGFQDTSQFVSSNVRMEGRGGDGPFIDHDTSSTVTVSNTFRLTFNNLAFIYTPVVAGKTLARFGGRTFATFNNCHSNVQVNVEAYMTSNLASNFLYGFIEINNCKAINYRRVADQAGYGGVAVAASNLQSIPARITHRTEGGMLLTTGGYTEVVNSHEQTIFAGSLQVVQPKTFVYAKATTGGLLSGTDPATVQIALPLHARPYKFRLLRDDVNAGSPFVLTLYAVVSAVDYEVARITPTPGVGGHFEADITTATGLAFFLRDDVDWDGKMKITKSGTINGVVGLIMIDYM